MLQATAIPTPTAATPTTSPLGTLDLILPVDFMQVDPVSTSLPLMLKCFTRQQLKPYRGRSHLPIQAAYIHIGTRFGSLLKESVSTGGFRFN